MKKDRIVPLYTPEENPDVNRSCRSNGVGCAAWVILNENMDYLHCSDIGWGGKASCKNIFNYNHSMGM